MRGLRLHQCNAVIVDAQSNELRVLGNVDLETKLAGVLVKHSFVVASIASEMLLGLDILQRCKCVVNFANNLFTCCDHVVELKPRINSSAVNHCTAVDAARNGTVEPILPEIVVEPACDSVVDGNGDMCVLYIVELTCLKRL